MIQKIFNPITILIISIISFYCYNHYNNHFRQALSLPKISHELKPGQCKYIKGLIGCEDIKIAQDSSFAILACGKDFKYKGKWGECEHFDINENDYKQNELDKFFHFDLDTNKYEEIKIINFPIGHTLDLHGIDLAPKPEKNGNYQILAINHLRNSSEPIEKFDYNPAKKELTWTGNDYSKTEGDLICANSLTSLDSDNYVVSNHAGYKNKWLVRAQTAQLLRGTPLTLFTNNTSKIIYDKINKSNGIALSKDHKLLFVANTAGASIEVFKVDLNMEGEYEFKHIKVIRIPLLPDNLNLDYNSGDIYVTGFTSMFEVLGYMSNAPNFKPEDKCSARVNRVSFKADSTTDIGYTFETETILEHDGSKVSMVTTAAPSTAKDKLLLSSIYSQGILSCKLSELSPIDLHYTL